jgi:hypothetical protein
MTPWRLESHTPHRGGRGFCDPTQRQFVIWVEQQGDTASFDPPALVNCKKDIDKPGPKQRLVECPQDDR